MPIIACIEDLVVIQEILPYLKKTHATCEFSPLTVPTRASNGRSSCDVWRSDQRRLHSVRLGLLLSKVIASPKHWNA